MDRERKIASVDVVKHDLMMVYFVDGSVVQVTLAQLLDLGVPRHPVPSDEEAFRVAVRKALN